MWQYRWWTWILAPLAALVVEVALLPHLFPPDALPNLVLAVVVAFALFETPRRGFALGLIAGALVDVDAGRLIGLNMALMGATGWVVATLAARIVRDDVFVPGVIGAVCQVAVRLMTWLMVYGLGFHVSLATLTEVLPVDTLFGLFMTPGLIGILHLRPRHEVDGGLKF